MSAKTLALVTISAAAALLLLRKRPAAKTAPKSMRVGPDKPIVSGETFVG